MTSKHPAVYTRQEIAYNNYAGRTMSSKAVKNAIKAGKVDVALELVLDLDDPNLTEVQEKGGRDVWKYDGDLSLEDTLKGGHSDVPQPLCSAISMFPGPMFPSRPNYVTQSPGSPVLCSPIPMFPGPMFPGPYVPQSLCPPLGLPVFPDTYVPG